MLGGMNLEFVYENAAKFPSLLLADSEILDDLPDLLVQDLFILFPETTNPLFECARLDNSHDESSELIVG